VVDFNHLDNLIMWKNPDQYHRNWKNRCESCLAPCCFFLMKGYNYDYENKDEAKSVAGGFFQNDFVIMVIRKENDEDIVDMGFNIQLGMYDEFNWKYDDDSGLGGLQICPLNIDSKCLIYEDRPLMCKMWKCAMKTIKGNKLT